MARLTADIRRKRDIAGTLKRATSEFKSLIDLQLPKKPLVGINGEIYLRSNRFSNGNLVKECEEAGLEVACLRLLNGGISLLMLPSEKRESFARPGN